MSVFAGLGFSSFRMIGFKRANIKKFIFYVPVLRVQWHIYSVFVRIYHSIFNVRNLLSPYVTIS
jgi:hypothetical protein